MNRFCKFILNLYYAFTCIFLLLKEYNMVLIYWFLSWLLYFLLDTLEAKNGKND